MLFILIQFSRKKWPLLQIKLLFSFSLDEKVIKYISYGPQESQGRFFFSFYNAIGLYQLAGLKKGTGICENFYVD